MKKIKFSVLLPSKDRFELLKNALYTVINQTYENFEIIISDNCSKDSIKSYVKSLEDDRIIYTRSTKPLTVTENWNKAIDLATGDYIIMLGDDDALLPGYFEKCIEYINSFNNPDFLTYGAYIYAYPGVLPWFPDGMLYEATKNQEFLRNISSPQLMTRELSDEMALDSIKLKLRYAFNMQYFLYSKDFIKKLKKYGPVYQGPYPDFYAANMSLLLGKKIALIPEPLVVIGISPKSYGYFFFNNQESKGTDLLANHNYKENAPTSVKDILLPVSEMDNSWLASVAIIAEKLPDRKDIVLDIDYYIKKQINNLYTKLPNIKALILLWKTIWPKFDKKHKKYVMRTFPQAFLKSFLSLTKVQHFKGAPVSQNKYKNIIELFDAANFSTDFY